MGLASELVLVLGQVLELVLVWVWEWEWEWVWHMP